MKKLIIVSVFYLIVFSINAQTTMKALIHDGPRSEMSPIPATSKYRITFALSGLDNDDQVKAFITHCKLFQGVVDVFVLGNANGYRNTTFEFDGKKDSVYFEKFLKHAGITALIYNNKEYKINELEKLSADKKEASNAKNSKQIPVVR